MLKVNNLAGFGARMNTSGPPVTSLAFQASATGTTSVTGPASIIAGDLLVLANNAVTGGGAPSATVPSGFTSIGTVADGASRSVISYKIADGSEASASIAGMSGASFNAHCLYVFRGDEAVNTVTPGSVAGQITTGNPTAQVVTSGSGSAPLVVIGVYGSDVAVSPRSFSPAKSGEINVSTFYYLAYLIYNSSPANVTVDMDDESNSNVLQSCYLEVL